MEHAYFSTRTVDRVIPLIHLRHRFEITGVLLELLFAKRGKNSKKQVILMEVDMQETRPSCDPDPCRAGGEPGDLALQRAASINGPLRDNMFDQAGHEPAERRVIEETVAQVFGVEGGDLRRATRGRAKVAHARQVAMYLAHVACGMSLTEVGRTFARDRTTVSHACGVIEDGRDDPNFDRVLELLEQVVQTMLRARGRCWASQGDWLLQ